MAKPIVTMIVTGAKSDDHGTEITLAMHMLEDKKLCKAEKKVRIPMAPSSSHPYEWAQEALCAMIDGLDCLCDVVVTHDPACTVEEGSHEA
jgi:hypothetical protein